MTRIGGVVGLWVGLLLPGLAPFVCPFPPFQDWPAHVGVIGALSHMDEPASRIAEFYIYTGWFKLNMLFYLPGWALADLLGPVTAANLCLAVSMASLGPAVWLLCRAVDADPRLALLATPLALGRHVYCGFGPNAAALPLFVGAVGLFFIARRGGRTFGVTIAMTAALAALAFTHAFIYLAGAGLILLLALGDAMRAPRRGAAAAAIGLVVSGGLFVVLLGQGLGVAGQAPGDSVAAVWTAIRHAPRDRLADTFWMWLFASYRYQRLDDLLQIGWAVVVAGGMWLAWALEGAGWWRSGRAALLGLAAVTVFMFGVLPENVGPPVNWWGARLRLPVMAALLCLPALGRRVGARATPFVVAGAALSVLTVALGLYDLGRFHRRYATGLASVLASMPPGRTISALHYTPRAVNEYPGEPFGYFGNYYLAAKGGAVPQDFFERKELPFQRRRRLPSPPWGIAAAFRWPQHAPGFDGFLLFTGREGHGPFRRHLDHVVLQQRAGAWRYYRKSGSATGGP